MGSIMIGSSGKRPRSIEPALEQRQSRRRRFRRPGRAGRRFSGVRRSRPTGARPPRSDRCNLRVPVQPSLRSTVPGGGMRIALAWLVLGSSLLTTPAHAQSERFRGLWEGKFHGGRGDQPMALTVRPRGAGGFAGTLYQEGMEMGDVESARISGDSLIFTVMSFDIVGVI